MDSIIGEKVVLKPITKEHTPLIVKWRNTDSVRNNFIYRETFTEEGHNHWMDTRVASGEVVQFIIYDKSADKPVGSVYFRDVDKRKKEAEYGIFIGEESARGKGLGTETAKLMCDFGFHKMGLEKIILRVFAFNKQAIKSYENAGFKQYAYLEKEVLIGDKYYDIIMMELKNK